MLDLSSTSVASHGTELNWTIILVCFAMRMLF